MQFTLRDLAYFIIAVIDSNKADPIKVIGDHTLCLLQEQISHNSFDKQIEAVNDFSCLILKSFLLNQEQLETSQIPFIFNLFHSKLNQLQKDMIQTRFLAK